MFRNDRCTIKRPLIENINGEDIYSENMTVYSNVPCHLSVGSVSAVNQSQSTAKVMYDFKLFIDTCLGVVIKPNDLIEVTTVQGQEYSLRAGESKIYALTTQTYCEDNKVV